MTDKIIGEGFTFDDVLLVPRKSDVLPSNVSLRTHLTRNIDLNMPLVSAAMDTVTEAALAIAIAREGGIGIIHKNMTPQEQAEQVDRVKRSESAIITRPYTLPPAAQISEALQLMKKYSISGIPIVEGGKLVGIVTHRDLRFERDETLKLSAIMTPRERLVTASIGTPLSEAESILQKHRIEKLLLVDEEGRLAGLITVKDIQKRLQFPNACKDKLGRLRVGAAVGVKSDTYERLDVLKEAGADVIVVDSAHGHSMNVIQTVAEIHARFPELDIIAGNVVTAEAALELADAGASAIKVGVGPGSICTTRVVAGVGVPQISAILDCVAVLQPRGIPLIADGGIRYSGDIAKAIAAGADSVMVGSLFAGTEESPGEMILYEGRSYKGFRGMGSVSAMRRGAADRYFQTATDAKLVPEGVEGRVPYKGRLTNTIFQLLGGIRSAMGYCGVTTIAEMQEKTRLIKISSAGLLESHPHDVAVTREAPNYELPASYSTQ
ncbi:IMP dehydrogenase [bacterium]|nr:IMP dehydrogenase [bacterium]